MRKPCRLLPIGTFAPPPSGMQIRGVLPEHIAGQERPLRRARLASSEGPASLRELHEPERGTAVRAVGIAERLAHFEMIVVLRLDQLDRLAGRFHGGGEVAALALEFGRPVVP